MIKQWKTLILMICLILLCLLLTACSSGKITPSEAEAGAVFYTVKCPDEIVAYAIENYSRITLSTFRINNLRFESREISLGYPFTAYEKDEEPAVYIFPVYCNGKIIMTLHAGFLDPAIYPEEASPQVGTVGGTGLLDRIDTLQKIFDTADADHPVFFYMDSHENFMARIGDEKILYWPAILPDLSKPTYEDVEIPEEALIRIGLDARLDTAYLEDAPVYIDDRRP